MTDYDLGYQLCTLLTHKTRQVQMARIEQAILLVSVERNRFWEGRASSFNEYLESENINRHLARRLMAVASKFYYELGAKETQLAQMGAATMTTLEVAARVVTKENLQMVMGIVSALPEKDAILSLEELGDMADTKRKSGARATVPLKRAINSYYALPREQRLDFHSHLDRARQQAQKPT